MCQAQQQQYGELQPLEALRTPGRPPAMVLHCEHKRSAVRAAVVVHVGLWAACA
jgi:hypothetical protein